MIGPTCPECGATGNAHHKEWCPTIDVKTPWDEYEEREERQDREYETGADASWDDSTNPPPTL